MNRIVFVSSVALAFIAGAAATHLLPQARAATDMTPQVIHIPDLAGDALGMPSGTGMRSKTLVNQDGDRHQDAAAGGERHEADELTAWN